MQTDGTLQFKWFSKNFIIPKEQFQTELGLLDSNDPPLKILSYSEDLEAIIAVNSSRELVIFPFDWEYLNQITEEFRKRLVQSRAKRNENQTLYRYQERADGGGIERVPIASAPSQDPEKEPINPLESLKAMLATNIKFMGGLSIKTYSIFLDALHVATVDGRVLRMSLSKNQGTREIIPEKTIELELRGLYDLTSMHAGFGHILVTAQSEPLKRARLSLLTKDLRPAAMLEIESPEAITEASLAVRDGLRVVFVANALCEVRVFSYFHGRLEEVSLFKPKEFEEGGEIARRNRQLQTMYADMQGQRGGVFPVDAPKSDFNR